MADVTHEPDLYLTIGGTAACRNLAVAFYARVAHHPILRPYFPGKTFTCAIEEFSAFLVQFLGGPSHDTQRRWWLSLHESHQRFKIEPGARDAWLATMTLAMDDVQLAEPLRTGLLAFFHHSSAHIINQEGEHTGGAEVPASAARQLKAPASSPKRPAGGPAADQGGRPTSMPPALKSRWDAHLQLDDAVAAIRTGDATRAIALARSTPCSPSVRSGLLALMLRAGPGALLEYVRDSLTADSALAHERWAGRTLLHVAAAVGNSSFVELLLSLGVHPDIQDAGGHTPLYSVANECSLPGAAAVVSTLAHAGASADLDAGVKRCTPLHMAARRGHVEIAAALLDCGANIEARDSLGETPLRRAVNCNKVAVAALLLSRGADRHSTGSKRLTPRQAARSAPMKELLK